MVVKTNSNKDSIFFNESTENKNMNYMNRIYTSSAHQNQNLSIKHYTIVIVDLWNLT